MLSLVPARALLNYSEPGLCLVTGWARLLLFVVGHSTLDSFVLVPSSRSWFSFVPLFGLLITVDFSVRTRVLVLVRGPRLLEDYEKNFRNSQSQHDTTTRAVVGWLAGWLSAGWRFS